MDSNKVKSWLKGVFYRNREAGAVRKVVVQHVAGTSGGNYKKTTVDGWEIGEKPSEDDLAELVHWIEDSVNDYVEGTGGLQKFELQAYHKAGETPFSTTVVRASAVREESHDEAFDSEPANAQGHLAMSMRHNEAIIRVAIGGTRDVIKSLQQENQQLREHNQALEAQRIESYKMMEEMLSHKQERELELRKAETSEHLKKESFEMVKLLAPAVLNRIMGKPVFPGASSPFELMVKSLAESISPDQITALQKVFNPGQLIDLMEIMKATQQKPAELPANGTTSA